MNRKSLVVGVVIGLLVCSVTFFGLSQGCRTPNPKTSAKSTSVEVASVQADAQNQVEVKTSKRIHGVMDEEATPTPAVDPFEAPAPEQTPEQILDYHLKSPSELEDLYDADGSQIGFHIGPQLESALDLSVESAKAVNMALTKALTSINSSELPLYNRLPDKFQQGQNWTSFSIRPRTDSSEIRQAFIDDITKCTNQKQQNFLISWLDRVSECSFALRGWGKYEVIVGFGDTDSSGIVRFEQALISAQGKRLASNSGMSHGVPAAYNRIFKIK